MPRPPSIQWYFKQYLGDNDVLKMDWEASGMHVWLLNLCIQEEPPGSIPNDMAVIRRWLRNPSDDVWRRVQPQIFTAWKFRDGRWFNEGMVRACTRKANYLHRYETGTRNARDSINTEDKEVVSTSKEKGTNSFHEERSPDLPVSALAVGWLHKIGIPSTVSLIQLAANSIEIVMAEEHLATPRACDWLLAAARHAKTQGVKVNRFWLEGGIQTWKGEGNASKAAERTQRNRSNILAGLGVGEDAGFGSPVNGAGGDTGRDSFVVSDLQRHQSQDPGNGVPRLLEDGQILPKAR